MPPDVLTHHAAALRQLARHLVRDPQRADDVVQETLLRGLQRGHCTQEPLRSARAWLERVLRNVVRSEHRAAHRRSIRELAAARPESTPPTDELVARRQSLRALTQAIEALPDELQECVFLRYFDALEPRAIAARLRLAPQVVYRRLERARALLRERLGPSQRRALCALFGLSRWPLHPILLTSTLIMAAKTSLATLALVFCGMVIIALACVAVWSNPTPNTPPHQQKSVPVATADVEQAGPAFKPDRQESALPEATTPLELLPYSFELEVRVKDRDDAPAGNVEVFIAPQGIPLNTAAAGLDGKLTLKWRGRTPSMPMVVGVHHSMGPELQRVTLHANSPHVVHLQTGSRFQRASAVSYRFQAVDVSDGPAAWQPSAPALALHDDGTCTFRIRPATVSRHTPEPVINTTWSFSVATAEAPEPTPGANVVGRVLTQDGLPAQDVLVAVGARDQLPWRTRTDEAGRFEIEGVPAGAWPIRAGGGDASIVWGTVEVGSVQAQWDARLVDDGVLDGRLIDDHGDPLNGWTLQLASEVSGWVDATKVAADGSFRVPNCPQDGVAMTIHVVRPDGAFPSITSYATPGRHLVLTVPNAQRAPGTIRATASATSEQAMARSEVWVWQGDRATRRAFTPPSSEVDRHTAIQLAPGSYEFVIHGAGMAPWVAGHHEVLAEDSTTLSDWVFPELAILDWDRGVPWRGMLHHRYVDATIEGHPHKGHQWVRPGSWNLLAEDGLDVAMEIHPGRNALQR